MNFKEELISLTKPYISPKLDELKKKLRIAAVNNKTQITLDASLTDDWCNAWLVSNGLKVKEFSDKRDSDWVIITWG